MVDTILDSGDTAVNRKDYRPYPHSPDVLVGETRICQTGIPAVNVGCEGEELFQLR